MFRYAADLLPKKQKMVLMMKWSLAPYDGRWRMACQFCPSRLGRLGRFVWVDVDGCRLTHKIIDRSTVGGSGGTFWCMQKGAEVRVRGFAGMGVASDLQRCSCVVARSRDCLCEQSAGIYVTGCAQIQNRYRASGVYSSFKLCEQVRYNVRNHMYMHTVRNTRTPNFAEISLGDDLKRPTELFLSGHIAYCDT